MIVEHGLDVDVFVARLRNCSDAPLHVLPVEFELCFGDVVVVLVDGLGIIIEITFKIRLELAIAGDKLK